MDAGLWALIGLAVLRALLVLGGYLTNGKSFPQPLDRKRETYYLTRLQEGDSQARNILIERNLRLVAHIVKKFDNTGEDTDDLISIGTIGLIKGVNTFDPAKGTRLATYAARCVENEILMHLRATRRLRSEMSLQDPIGMDREGNEITLMDILQVEGIDLDELVSNRLLAGKMREKVKELGSRERQVLEMRFGLINGRRSTQREVARQLGISRSYVSRIEKRAVQNLCRFLQLDRVDQPAGHAT
ncbi:MAG: RNA polymerase sporulation sigma factor SigK [Thermaerobacterales bacterium]